MRWFGLMAAAISLLGAGCWTTTIGRAGDPSAQRWLADHADSEAIVTTADGRPDQTGMAMEATSPTEFRFRTLEGTVAPIDNVRQVTVVKHGRGTLDGLLLGLGIGALGGYLYGLTRGLSTYEASMDCTIVCNNSDAANWGALEFGVLGLLVGTITGAVAGHRDILDLR